MATREALAEELNPFQIAKQQFNRAADYLDLDHSTRNVLSSPKRQLIVSIPVKMDGGDVQVFRGLPRPTQHRARALQGRHPLSPKRDAG